MSKLLLYYTPNGLFFECHIDTLRTEYQERVKFEIANPNLLAHLQLKASFPFTTSCILDFWYHAIEVYSACHLTKPDNDRILAVAVLASEVKRILADPK